jgi:hypothetical protein
MGGLPGGGLAPREVFRSTSPSAALLGLYGVTNLVLANLLLATLVVYLRLRHLVWSQDPLNFPEASPAAVSPTASAAGSLPDV